MCASGQVLMINVEGVRCEPIPPLTWDDANQYVARMVGGQDFIGIHARTGPYRYTHVRGGHGCGGGSEGLWIAPSTEAIC